MDVGRVEVSSISGDILEDCRFVVCVRSDVWGPDSIADHACVAVTVTSECIGSPFYVNFGASSRE